MSRQHTRKLAIRVTPQTAHHITMLAQAAEVTPGQVIDALMIAVRRGVNHEPKQEFGGGHPRTAR